MNPNIRESTYTRETNDRYVTHQMWPRHHSFMITKSTKSRRLENRKGNAMSKSFTGKRGRLSLVLTMIAATCALGLPASHASAIGEDLGFSVGGCTGSCPGSVIYQDPPGGVRLDVTCTSGRLGIIPSASAQAGYTNGQFIAYRYFIQANNGYQYLSGWSGWTSAPYTRLDQSILVYTPLTILRGLSFAVPTTRSWTVLVQVAWYTARGNVLSGWYGPTDGYSQGGTQRWFSNCLT